MNAIELFDGDEAELPRRASTNQPYIVELERVFNAYVSAVGRLAADDAVSRAILDQRGVIPALADDLLEVHRATLNGRVVEAREAMNRAVERARPYLPALTSVPLTRQGVGPLFRLRIAEPSESIDRGGMFHIPLDRRDLVRPQRYSMLGIPMLYLGSTIFVSWEELGRPPLSRIWVSGVRLRAGQTMRVINFGYRPAFIAAMLANGGNGDPGREQLATAYAILWPLIAACSFRSRIPNASFVEEYVVPQQLIAHLVETDDFDGIRYFSNRITPYTSEGTLLMNFALPARPEGGERFAPRLVDLFEMTPPMPYDMVVRLGRGLNRGDPVVRLRRGILEAIAGHPVPYEQTDFFRVERLLAGQDFGAIE